MKRSGKILLEGTIEEFKKHCKGADSREYLLINTKEIKKDGTYTIYQLDSNTERVTSISAKGKYGKLPFIHYDKLYLTFIANSKGTFVFLGTGQNAIQYSTDNGVSWSAPLKNLTINVNIDDEVLWKGNNMHPWTPSPNGGIGYFKGGTASFDVCGNILSLYFGDDFKNNTDLGLYQYTFYKLFSECPVINANNLILGASRVGSLCYAFMFKNSTSLVKGPLLKGSIETLQTLYFYSPYYGMYSGTNVVPDCSDIDFSDSLTLSRGILMGLFYNTKVTDNDLRNILPINPQTNHYYLPATTLASNCYMQMFYGCASLITAPELPATTLYFNCYQLMFQGCTSLNFIKMLATNISASDCLSNWVDGVAANGTFVRNSSMTSLPTGEDGIPEGWKVEPPIPFFCKLTLNNGNIVEIEGSGELTQNQISSYSSSAVGIELGELCTAVQFLACFNWTSLRELTISKSVQKIGNAAFFGTSLVNVTLPDNNITIDICAFQNCTALTTVSIPDSITNISPSAFIDCTSLPVVDNIRYADTFLVEAVDKTLATYTIKEGTRFIGYNAFSGCESLTDITIPNSVLYIGDDAFTECTSLTSIDIPNKVTHIGEEAFCYCTSLSSITIPDSVTSIDRLAFSECTSLPIINDIRYADTAAVEVVDKTLSTYTIKESTRFICSSAFDECEELINITIPNSIISIGESAFEKCSSLTSIVIPNSVTEIGASAFADCTSLINITIPNSVTSIGGNIFCGCTALTSVTLSNNITNIDYSTFSNCTSLSSITIPNSVTSIGSNAFNRCTSLSSIIIPNNVTNIDEGAFRNCTGITSITIPDNVTYIEREVFGNCTGLTSITLGNNVTIIGYEAFKGCTSLSSITMPDSVTEISSSIFNGCTSLSSIISLAMNVPETNSQAFDNINANGTLYVPQGSTGYDTWLTALGSGWTIEYIS